MITEDKLNQVRSKMLDSVEITTKELKKMGFTQHDLATLVESGCLIRIKIGHYSVPVKELHDYGKFLIKNKEYDKAYQVFKVCNEREPNNVSTLLQLLYQSISRKDYEHIFEYFENIFFNDNCAVNNKADNYLYLYLLSCITDVPKKYQCFLDSLSVEDIELKKQTSMYTNLVEVNRFRRNILENRFKPAINSLQKMTRDRNFSSIREMILKELLVQANNEKQKNLNELRQYIDNKDYASVVLVLEAEKENHQLPLNLEYLLFLARDYLEIEHTGVLPVKPNFTINNTFNAISHKDYARALELLTSYSEAKSIPLNNQLLYLALIDINKLIDSLNIKIEGDDQLVFAGFESKKELIGEQLEIPEFTEPEITYADIVMALIGKKPEEVRDILNKYYNQKGITEYQYIIDNLLEIGILENDLSYSKAMLELANISQQNYVLDVSSYIQGFYLALNTDQYLVAQHYLNIIELSNELLSNKINVEVLKTTLEQKQKKEVVEQPLAAIEVVTRVESTKPKSLEKPKERTSDADEALVQNKIALFETGVDIVILKTMNRDRRKRIHRIVANIPSVKSFSIGTGESRRIVLTNSPYLDTRIDKRAIAIEGDKAYRDMDYERCIACYRKLLYVARPNPNIYAKLGLAYMKKNQLKKAVEYLTISTELSKEIDGRFDFTELIAKLIGKEIQQDDTKPKFKMSEEEFSTEENYYGIQYISEVSRMVFAEGISLEEACKKFNYDLNQINVIRLIYAEEYYSAGDYKAGDALLKVVSKSKNKSKRVKTILESVISRKKFYKNRPKDKEQSFVYMYK